MFERTTETASDIQTKYSVKLGNRIRDLRKSRGLSQMALSEMCGCSNEMISYLENGCIYAPRVWLIASIAQAFGVTIDELIGLEEV